jgi:hypothetical protein
VLQLLVTIIKEVNYDRFTPGIREALTDIALLAGLSWGSMLRMGVRGSGSWWITRMGKITATLARMIRAECGDRIRKDTEELLNRACNPMAGQSYGGALVDGGPIRAAENEADREDLVRVGLAAGKSKKPVSDSATGGKVKPLKLHAMTKKARRAALKATVKAEATDTRSQVDKYLEEQNKRRTALTGEAEDGE